MIDANALAKPYAKAAFEYALERTSLLPWRRFLSALSYCVRDAKIEVVLQSPEFSGQKLITLLLQLTEGLVPDGGENFVRLISQYKRASVLPCIASLFDELCLVHEQRLHVDVTTAIEMQESEKNSLSDVLSKRFKQAIDMHCDVKPAILGGMIVRIGDRVFDGSYLTQIRHLTNVLTT